MSSEPWRPTPAVFDAWYAAIARSRVADEIWQRCLGLPSHLLSTGLLTLDGLAEVVSALRLSPGDVLLDVGCGRAGYGLEVAARTGARLIGIDYSHEAVRVAAHHARELGQDAQFSVGDLCSTGLRSSSVDAVMCIDAIHFADEPDAAYRELHRVLTPKGRVVMTCWEPCDPTDQRLPEPMRRVDLARSLVSAGFEDVQVLHRPEWRDAERRLWEEGAALDPGGDAALQELQNESVFSLPLFDAMRRVLAVASAGTSSPWLPAKD